MHNSNRGHPTDFTGRPHHRPQNLHPRGLVRSPYASMDIDNRDDDEPEGDPDGDVSYWDQPSAAQQGDRTRQSADPPRPRQHTPASSNMGLWSAPEAKDPRVSGGRARPSSNFNPRPINPRGYESDRPAGGAQSTFTNSMLLSKMVKRQDDQEAKIDGLKDSLNEIKALLLAPNRQNNNLDSGAASDSGASRKGPVKSTKPKDQATLKEAALRDTVREGVTTVLGVNNTTNPPPPLPNGPNGERQYLLLDPKDMDGKTTVVRPHFDRGFWEQSEWHHILIDHLRKNGSSTMTKLELEGYTDRQILEKTAACVWKTMVGNWKKRDRPTEIPLQKARATQRAVRKAATLEDALQSIRDLRGKSYQALAQPQVQSGEETDPNTGKDGTPKVLCVREPTWRAPWVNCLAQAMAQKKVSRSAKGKGTSGSVTTHQRVLGEPVEVELPDLTAAGLKIPRSAIDDNWLQAHPLRGEARDLVDWTVTKLPDLSDFLARISLVEPSKQEDEYEPGPSYGAEEPGPSAWAGAIDVSGAERAPEPAHPPELVGTPESAPALAPAHPPKPNHAAELPTQYPYLGMGAHVPGYGPDVPQAPSSTPLPRLQPQQEAAPVDRNSPLQAWAPFLDPTVLNNPSGAYTGYNLPPGSNHPLAYQVQPTANNPFGIPGVHVMPPPPPPIQPTPQIYPFQSVAVSQPRTSNSGRFDTEEALNGEGGEPLAGSSRGHTQGRRGGRSRGRGTRGRGNGGVRAEIDTVPAESIGNSAAGEGSGSSSRLTRGQKKKADELVDMIPDEESEPATTNSAKRTRRTR